MTTSPTTTTTNRSRSRRQIGSASQSKKDDDGGGMYFVKAGLPMLLFCGLGVWVVSNGIEGKNRERDAFQGRISKYVRHVLRACVCVFKAMQM